MTKIHVPMLTLLIVAAFCLTTPRSIHADDEANKDVYARWSVLGDWKVTHPYWTDVLTLREDGTFSTKQQETSGRWMLTADAGTPVLVLKWDRWSTESVAMVALDHFRGQIKPGSYIDMRRGE
jgi:hypothetical protein